MCDGATFKFQIIIKMNGMGGLIRKHGISLLLGK